MRMAASVLAYTVALLCIAGIFYNATAVAIGLMGTDSMPLYELHRNIIGIIVCGIGGAAIGELGDFLQCNRGLK